LTCIAGHIEFDLPETALVEGVLRDVFFLSFLALMMSLLGFALRVPPESALPGKVRSGGPRAAWATELTVSVSTVMFLVAASTPDFSVRLLKELFEVTTFGLGVESTSLERPWGFGERVRSPLSLLLSPFASFVAARGVFLGETKDCSSSDKMVEGLGSVLLRFTNQRSTTCHLTPQQIYVPRSTLKRESQRYRKTSFLNSR
jgi:hypothetical protein